MACYELMVICPVFLDFYAAVANLMLLLHIISLKMFINLLLDYSEMQAVLWYTDTLKPKTTLEEHSMYITDVRFSPSMARLATSSFDKTVRVWDADNVS